MDLSPEQVDALLRRMVDTIAGGSAASPPPQLRARVLGAALAARAPRALPRAGAVDAVLRQLAQLDAVVDATTPESWARPTAAAWTVKELVGHVTEVLTYVGALLGFWDHEAPAATEHDHRSMTAPAVELAAALPPAEVVARWRARRAAFVAPLGQQALPERVALHTLPMSTRAALTTVAFELWTHGDDIRRAIGAPLVDPSGPDVGLMADAAVRSLALGLQLAGIDRAHRTVRVVLTGPGGSAWVRRLGPDAPPEPDTTLVADAVAFCRMAAQRLAIDELAIHVDGDERLARDVLAGSRIFSA